MIERKFVSGRIKEYQIQEYVEEMLNNVGHSHTKMQLTPLGEKITIYAARPGLIVGRKGENIKKLTKNLKKKFGLENPQIEISEVENPFLDANIVAEKIASTLERFGPQRFKGIGHRSIQDVITAGARGIEILISGKIPGARAKTWRFYKGYLKKSGEMSITAVKTAYAKAILKTGTIGIQVSIMSPAYRMPDDVRILEETEEKKVEETKEGKEKKPAKKEEKKEVEEKKTEEKPAQEEKKTAEKKEAPVESKEGDVQEQEKQTEKTEPKAEEKKAEVSQEEQKEEKQTEQQEKVEGHEPKEDKAA